MSFPVTLTSDDLQAFDTLDLLPLRQTVRRIDAAAAGFGGHSRLDALSRPERFRILRRGNEGRILARNGLALAEAQRVLRQAYGAAIHFEAPTAHRVIDHASGATLVPMMSVRVDAPRVFKQDLLQILAERSTPPGEVALHCDRMVLRAESPLPALIGLEGQVLERTRGAGHVVCWLARYRPATGLGAQGVRA